MKRKMKKIKAASNGPKLIGMALFVLAFAGIGGLIVLRSRAASGVCSTSGVIGSATYNVNAPETAQYRVWVRMQVPDTSNSGNTNGIRLEFDGPGSADQCFTVTTTASDAVNTWKWVNSDATAASTPHVTSSLAAGNYTAKILGLKAGVKVDKVMLLRSDNTCTPDNVISGSRQPGDNCTTPPPTVTISANPTTVVAGGSSSLTWSSTNATSCTGSGAWGNSSRPTAGNNVSTGPLNTVGTATFTITCTGIGGTSVPASATVTVTAPPAPSVTLSASPTTVNPGGSTTLTWTVTNPATSCTAGNGWSGSKSPSGGTESISNITANRTFTLQCTGPGGTSNTASVTVNVNTAPGPDTQAPVVTMNITGLNVGANDTTLVVRNLKSIEWRPTTTDNVGVTSVEYRVNGNLVTLTNGSYIFGNQGNLTNGNGDYQLRVVARDAAGNTTEKNLLIRLRHPDINRNGIVDATDLGVFFGQWQKASTLADFNVNGIVDATDLGFFFGQWMSTQ